MPEMRLRSSSSEYTFALADGLAEAEADVVPDGLAVPLPPPEQPASASIAAVTTPSADTFRIRFTLRK